MTPLFLRCKRTLLAGAALWLVLAAPGRVAAGEAYYLLVFGSQRVPNNPNYSHSFATFARAAWPGDGPCLGAAGLILETRTISWLPRTGKVRTFALHPECGRNFRLHETVRYALANGERVSLWGPYRVEPDLYDRALRRAAQLEGGTVLYKADDSGRRDDRVSNCIHAVAAITEARRLRVVSPGWGEVASYAILLRMRPWVLDRGRTEDWVALALGLDAYPIIYRDWAPPGSGALLGPVFRLLGGEGSLEPSYGPPPYRGRH